MCGINGFNFLDKRIIKRMNSLLNHRGPDSSGTLIDEKNCISLGHTRLSILDLSKSGNQPMFYKKDNKKAAIIFNGEIYNFKELRSDLEKKGYKFKSTTDTEVLLASYIEDGFDCVKKFNGMWAFCIYDLNKKILFLSRDRLGKKPLHYYFDGKSFIFSSELKPILEHKIEIQISKKALDLYLAMGFIMSPYSIYENIKKLEPRQNLVFDIKNKKIKTSYYYDLPEYNPQHNKEELIGEAKRLLADAVKLRMVSDVPLGAFLSGGLDSSAVVSEMIYSKKDINTFSIGFKGEYDESKSINLLKDKFGTKHHHKYFYEKDFQKLLSKIFYYYDEPFADSSMFPSFFLSEFAKKTLTVSLTGDGGDEIFGGYMRYSKMSSVAFARKIPSVLRKIVLRIPLNWGVLKKLKRGLKLSLKNLEDIYAESRENAYFPEFYKNFLRERMKICLKLAKNDLAEACMMIDKYFVELPDHFLHKIDRASMANSLEIRSPFLDYRFIEFSSRIPLKWKVSKTKTKILMREMLKDTLPKEILRGKKRGFSPPIDRWMSESRYIPEIKRAVLFFYEKGILSEEWKNFYIEHVLVSKDSEDYLTRMFLLYRWYEYWFLDGIYASKISKNLIKPRSYFLTSSPK